jgi:hypothetical protein
VEKLPTPFESHNLTSPAPEGTAKDRPASERPIVLVGLMGVGKSTIGRRLARRLGLPFVDSDSAIEDAAGGASTAEVFELYGEAEFRDGERRLVARLVEGERRVIATGGGAFVNEATRKLLKAQAITPASIASAAPIMPKPTFTSAAATARTATWSMRSSPRSTTGWRSEVHRCRSRPSFL